jgi:hypothetical protein
MKDRIYRYVVRYDAGAAPNPFGGWCSLAICKPTIRRTARVGDWIIGLRSRHTDHVVYVMQVQESLSISDYWSDPRFREKRPDRCPSSDNIYRPDSAGGLVQVPNRVHSAEDIARDLGGRRVLVSQRFWYFGDQSPPLPTALIHLVHEGQSHSLPAHRKDTDLQDLAQWLARWPGGVHGRPMNSDRLQATMHGVIAVWPHSSQKSPQVLRPHQQLPRANC